MKFYINKHPIIIRFNYNNGEDHEALPVGLAFIIDGISRDSYSLKPVKAIKKEDNKAYPLLDFTPEILRTSFTEVDYLPD